MYYTPDELRHAFTKAGFADLAEEMIAAAAPGVAVTATPASDDAIPVGASKFGGGADLPESAAWPTREGQPLAFLAQIDLAQVHLHDRSGLLPETGRLLFFYDVMGQVTVTPGRESDSISGSLR